MFIISIIPLDIIIFIGLCAVEPFRNTWWDSDGKLYLASACEFLARVYISLAKQHETTAQKELLKEKDKERVFMLNFFRELNEHNIDLLHHFERISSY